MRVLLLISLIACAFAITANRGFDATAAFNEGFRANEAPAVAQSAAGTPGGEAVKQHNVSDEGVQAVPTADPAVVAAITAAHAPEPTVAAALVTSSDVTPAAAAVLGAQGVHVVEDAHQRIVAQSNAKVAAMQHALLVNARAKIDAYTDAHHLARVPVGGIVAAGDATAATATTAATSQHSSQAKQVAHALIDAEAKKVETLEHNVIQTVQAQVNKVLDQQHVPHVADQLFTQGQAAADQTVHAVADAAKSTVDAALDSQPATAIDATTPAGGKARKSKSGKGKNGVSKTKSGQRKVNSKGKSNSQNGAWKTQPRDSKGRWTKKKQGPNTSATPAVGDKGSRRQASRGSAPNGRFSKGKVSVKGATPVSGQGGRRSKKGAVVSNSVPRPVDKPLPSADAPAPVDEAPAGATDNKWLQANEKFQECVRGEGKFGFMKMACELLQRGMAFGGRAAGIKSISFPDCGGAACIEGVIDMSKWFGAGIPDFTLKIAKSGKSFGFELRCDQGVHINMGKFFKNLAGGASGALIAKIVDGVKLDKNELVIYSVALNVKPFGMRISGTVIFYDLKMDFHAVMTIFGSRVEGGVSISIPGYGIMQTLQKISPAMSKITSVFDIMNLDFSLATQEINLQPFPVLQWDVRFPSLPRGLALAMITRFQPNSNNALVKMLQKAMPGEWRTTISFDGVEFKLKLALSDITISPTMRIFGAGFFIGASIKPPSMTIGLEASLEVKVGGEPLTFSASVKAQVVNPQVAIRLTMLGMWRKAFGIPVLSIGNIVGELVLTPRPPFIGAIELGGQLELGTGEGAITGKVYFRLDIASPLNNYFFGSVSKVTIGSLLAIFGVHGVPSLIADSGFPRGCEMSFAVIATQTPAGDEIPMGFRLKGGARFLGWDVDADIVVAPTMFRFKLVSSPIKLGPLQIVRSPENTAKGPKIFVEGTAFPFGFQCDIEGYIDAKIFSAYVKMKVDSESMHAKFASKILGFIRSDIELKIKYKGGFDVYFKATLDTTQGKEDTLKAIRDFKESATRALRAANEKVEAAKRAAHSKIDSACDASKGCGMKCNVNLLQLADHIRHEQYDAQNQGKQIDESMLEFANTLKTHIADRKNSAFDISFEEYNFLEQLSHLHDVARAHTHEELIAMGALRSNEDAQAWLAANADEADHFAQLQQEEQHHEVLLEQWAEMQENEMALDSMTQAEMQEMWEDASDEERAQLRARWGRWSPPRISLPPRPCWDCAKRALQNAGHAIKHAVHTAVHHVKDVAHKVAHHVKKAAQTVVHHVKKGIAAGLNGLCKAGNAVCSAGCAAAKGIAKGAVSLGTGLASGVLKLAELTVIGVTKLIDELISNIDIYFSIAGALNAEGVEFGVDFKFRAWGAKFGFKFQLKITKSFLKDLVAKAWQFIKKQMLGKIPGLGKLLG